MTRKIRRLLRGLLYAGIGLLIGLYLVCLPLFETRGDRERILRNLDVPSDFHLLAVESGGNRVGLWNDGPRSIAYYSAPWDDGGLCAAVKQLAHQLSSDSLVPDPHFPRAACAYSFFARPGWFARLVNEWAYGGSIVTYPPSDVPPPSSRYARGLPPERTLVVVRLLGKFGY